MYIGIMVLQITFAVMSSGLIPVVLVKSLAVMALMGSAVVPSSINVDLARCLETTGTVDPNYSRMINTFTTEGAFECWLYCKASFRCWVASFDIMNSTCYLFKNKTCCRKFWCVSGSYISRPIPNKFRLCAVSGEGAC